MDLANRLEQLFHEIMMREAKGEEAKQWETSRHELMVSAINDSCNYYGQRGTGKYEDFEREM